MTTNNGGVGTAGLPVKMKLGYGVGDLAFNILINITSIFLLIFYTDVFLIDPWLAGLIFLVSKLWNALIDPFIGYFIDRTDTRWGKMRPYMIFGAAPLAVCFFLVCASPDLEESMRFAYGMATFLLFNSAFAIANVPYAALTASLTRDADERSNLTAYRMTFATVGMLIAGGATKPLVNLFSSEATGYRIVAIIFGLFSIGVILLSAFNVKETVHQQSEDEKRISLNLKALSKNYPFILLVLSFVVTAIAVYAMASTTNYFFTYYVNREDLISPALVILFVSAVIAFPLWLKVSKKTSKKATYISGLIVFGVSLVGIYLFRDIAPWQLLILIGFAGAGMSTYILFPWAMVPDTVEYSQWKTGIRQEGFLYGFFVFGLKLSQAFAGFFTGMVLSYVGYVANVEQTPEALNGIRFLMTIMPCILITIGILLIVFYPITSEMHKKMLEDIEKA